MISLARKPYVVYGVSMETHRAAAAAADTAGVTSAAASQYRLIRAA